MEKLFFAFVALATIYGCVDAGTSDPSITSSATASVDENKPSGTDVQTITTTNPANMNLMVMAQVPESTPRKFAIGTGNSADKLVTTAAMLDHETQGSYTVTIKATDPNDSTRTAEKTITVTVNDMNEAPAFSMAMKTFNVGEGKTGTVGTVMATDPEGDTLTYSFKENSNKLMIESANNNGTIKVKTGQTLTEADDCQIEVTVVASDTATPPLNGTIMVKVIVDMCGENSGARLATGMAFLLAFIIHFIM